jgi:hypothetical protein
MHEIKINNQISNPPNKIDCDFIHNKIKSQSKLKQTFNKFMENINKIKNNFLEILNFSFLSEKNNEQNNFDNFNNFYIQRSFININSSFELLGVLSNYNILMIYIINSKGK